jgi:hypothetical protein
VGDVGVQGAEGRNRVRRAGLPSSVEGIVEKSKAEEVGKGERGGGRELEVMEGEVLEIWESLKR